METEATNKKHSRLVCIQYPGIVQNVFACLETLGGLKSLSADYHKDKAPRICYHPDNPYNKPTVAQKQDGGLYLVIKVRRKKRGSRGAPDTPSTSGDPDPVPELGDAKPELSVEILGPVSTLYQFRGMCDHQYLPMERKEGSNYEPILDRLIPPNLDAALKWIEKDGGDAELTPGGVGLETIPTGPIAVTTTTTGDGVTTAAPCWSTTSSDVPVFLPPFSFSRFHFSSNFILCRETDYVLPVKNKLKTMVDAVGVSLRTDRKAHSILVNHGDVFPTAPNEHAVRDADMRFSPNIQQQLQKILEERPLVSKNYVLYHIRDIEEHGAKLMFPKFAFYIKTGPWGRLWCRFGYDPRKTPEAKKYQIIQLHMAKSTTFPVQDFIELRRVHQYRVRTVAQGIPMPPMRPPKDKDREADDLLCSFTFKRGILPSQRQVYIQMCDIDLPEARDVLSDPGVVAPKCHPQFGWIHPQRLDHLRQVMFKDVESTVARIKEEKSAEDSANMDKRKEEEPLLEFA